MCYKNIIMSIVVIFTPYAYSMQKSPSALPDIYVPLQLIDEKEQLVRLSIPPEIWEYITTLSSCKHQLQRLCKFFRSFYTIRNAVVCNNISTPIANVQALVTTVKNLPKHELAKEIDTLFGPEQTTETTVSGRTARTPISYHHHETTAARTINPITTMQRNTEQNTVNAVALYNACLTGNIAAVITALDNGQTLSPLKLALHESPMHIAARHGHTDLIEALARRGISVDVPDKIGATPLMYAAQQGNLKVVATLHALGAHVNSTDNLLQSTPLYYAVMGNYLPIVVYLINNGANLAHTRKLGDTLLHTAIEANDNYALLNYLLSCHIIPINHTSAFDETPLMLACKKGLYTAAQTLIGHGANVNCGGDKQLPCDIAYENKHFDIVKLLRNHKARHSIKFKPLDMLEAIVQEDVTRVEALLALNAKVTEPMIEQAIVTNNTHLTNLLCNATAPD